jgi:hypothetical protein
MDNRKDFTGAKNVAHITLTLNEDGKCGIHWKGDTIQLADILYTTMQHDSKMAALICQTAKDFIETCKGNPERWKQLTVDCAETSEELAHRYVRHPLINKPGEHATPDGEFKKERTQQQIEEENEIQRKESEEG